jgi:aqualysin 1
MKGEFEMKGMKTRKRLPPELQRPWKRWTIACSALLALMGVVVTMTQCAPKQKLAPVLNETAKNRIPGQYIVVFKPDTPIETVEAAKATARKFNGRVIHTYTSALIGFSAKLPPEALQALRANPHVAYIEADKTGSIQTIQPPNPPGTPPTGLDRIDRRTLPLNNTYTYTETGVGVNAYILDTGVRVTNTDFGGRADGVFNAIADGHTADTDCNGHGTNVAGIVGGTRYGVAKGVNLHSVRVAQCTGTVAGADAIAGVD